MDLYGVAGRPRFKDVSRLRGGKPDAWIGSPRAVLVVAAAVMAVAGSGCASAPLASLRPVPHNPLAETFQIKSWSGPKPSERTMLVLRRTSLDERVWRRLDTKPDEILAGLTQAYEAEPHLETVYAMAEINYIAAGRREDDDERRSTRYYLQCVERCYQYLFDPQFDTVRNPYDPQFRGACNLYNSALERSLRFARKEGMFKSGGRVSFAAVGSKLQLDIVPKGFDWGPESFGEFEFVSDYQLKGLENRYQTHGLGVPLIAIRKRGTSRPDVERHYARNLSFPVTAFLRLNHWEKGDQRSSGPLNGQIELYDPLDATDIPLAGLRVPLESDITTPLAYFLDTKAVRQLDLMGLFHVDKARKLAGLYMVQPYQPDKIPVVMIHGLYSSPMTWLEAFNDLRSNPEFRDRYQFWFYLYPTGQPFWQSAADLREYIVSVQQTFGTPQRPMAMSNMVLVGHSMGGLIARMVTQDSGDRYWQAVSKTPFQQVKGDQDSINEIERVYFFQHIPTVSRVITLGSPFRGSDYANGLTQKIARNAISFPKRTAEGTARLLTMNPDLFRDSAGTATSLDSLDPDSPVLRVLAETPPTTGVRYHNVVGITKKDVPLSDNTDGVVSYPSAHRDDVESELVVRADHVHVHRNPLAVNELSRILKLHLQTVDAGRPNQVVPAASSNDATGRGPGAKGSKGGTLNALPGSEAIYRDGTGLDDWRPSEEDGFQNPFEQ